MFDHLFFQVDKCPLIRQKTHRQPQIAKKNALFYSCCLRLNQQLIVGLYQLLSAIN
jgi:hypothetical protein